MSEREYVARPPPAAERRQQISDEEYAFNLWAALLPHTFNLQMKVCVHCHGKLQLVAAISETAAIEKYPGWAHGQSQSRN
ncbi:MAG: hypothetical protein JXR76_10200 [Deltaproteobacteria bacterium]|nr:hypothetical protein [Deltaproteobacteria bacterium]